MKTKSAILSMLILLFVIGITVVVTGGDLNPGNTPSPTMRTLDELYKNIQPGLPSDWLPFAKEQQATGNSSIHLQLTANGADVHGSCNVQGKEDSIVVVGLGHTVEREALSQTSYGTPIHRPIILTKYIDKSSPLIAKALFNNETIEAYLRFYRTPAAGGEEHYYTIHLQMAKIVKIQSAFPNLEQVSIAYGGITWTWEPDGIEFTDTWSPPG